VHVSRAFAAALGCGGDADNLDVGPAEEHRERAGIVGVAREISIEVNSHENRYSRFLNACATERVRVRAKPCAPIR
jgi:hypothetical protein